MNRRTTEDNNHEFQKNLYSKLNAFDLQGITMNANRDKFTIGVEYFDLSFEEYQQVKHQDSIVYQIKGMLPFEHIKAQVIFTESLNVPLYYIWGYEDYFLLHELYRDNDKIVYKPQRSEEHTSELQSRFDLVCRLLLEKKNNKITILI